jgi:hypothetical protein
MTTKTWIKKSGFAASLLCVGSSGCGFGTAAVVSSSSGGGGASGQSVASALLAPRSPTSPASIFFVLTDQEGDAADVEIRFREQGVGDFRPITLASGSASLTKVPSKQTATRVLWDFATDLGGAGYHDGIEIQLLVNGGISPPVLTGVTQGNDAPQILDAGPAPAGAGEYGGNTDVTFTVADSAADTVRVKVEFNEDSAGGFPASAWKVARPAETLGGEPTPEFALVGIDTTAAGKVAGFRWDTLADLNGFDADLRLRLTPADDFAPGVPIVTVPFRIDNNAPPQALLDESSLAFGIKQRGNIPLPLRLFDQESDPLKVMVQWRTDGQAFPVLPTTAAELTDLLENPARQQERKQKQIAVEAPPAFTGHVGSLAGLAPNQVRLPEVSSSAAGLLAYGIAGRTLEILRPSMVPEPVVWTPNPLNGPVAALPSTDFTALVLDSNGMGWRLREIDLETGTVVRDVATGPGVPGVMGLDPSGARVFVGSSVAMFRFDRISGAALGSVPLGFADGPRGVAPLGLEAAVVTGDDKLVRVDFATGAAATVRQGLSEPWGVVLDPLADGSVYLAERAANRVSSVDLDRLAATVVAAQVAPADVGLLGAIPFPSPRALALENRGTRLLVMTQSGALASLRLISLRSATDFDGASDGRADPFVREVTGQLGDAGAGLCTGPDQLRVVSLSQADRLALGGGVMRRRLIVEMPRLPGDPIPYDPTTQAVTLASAIAPSAGAPWRIRAPAKVSAPTGQEQTFVWDTADLPDPASVQVRILPIDGDAGTSGTHTGLLPLRASFEPSPTTLSAPFPSSSWSPVVAADCDGDGDMDLVALATGIRLFLQVTPGVFTPGSVIPAPGQVTNIAAADLDADGDMDLAGIVNGNLVLFVQSAGSFVAVSTHLPAGGLLLTAADFDSDGDIDLFAGSRLFLQTGPGVFALGPPVPAGGLFVVAADLDGDGDVDLASGGTLHMQTGPGEFTSSALESLVPLAAADLDGDGDVDLVSRAAGFVPYFQTMPGVFVAGDPLTTSTSPWMIAAPDLDGAGDTDLVSITLNSQSVTLSYQTTPGVFTSADLFTGGDDPRSLVAADLDGDGDLDLALVDRGDSTLTLFFQDGQGLFSAAQNPIATPIRPLSIAVTDLDRDGKVDLVASSTESEALSLVFQAASGNFSVGPLVETGSSGAFIAAADLDGDGDQDLVTTTNDAPEFDLKLFLQEAPGTFTAGATLFPPNNGLGRVVIADLDGDGRNDLVVPAIGTGGFGFSLKVFCQAPSGAFVACPDVVGTGNIWSFAVADLDSDGDADLVVGNGNPGLLLFFQVQPGVFAQSVVTLPTGPTPRSIAGADLDGDGDLDLVSANGDNNTLSLFFQVTPGSFSPMATTIATGAFPIAVVAADLDGDGDMDLVSANQSDNTLSVFLQSAPGVFIEGALLPVATGGVLAGVAAADLDGDGDVDLVANDFWGSSLSLFFGGK